MIDLKKTFTCGQCFRWREEPDGSFTGIVKGKIYNLREESRENGDVRIRDTVSGQIVTGEKGTSGDYICELYDYLDLGTDYDRIDKYLAKRDEIIKKAIEEGRGIHILKQEFWETLISFIISQNNNIPRITGCIEKLAELAGEYIGEYGGTGKRCYSLPTPEKLANMTLDELTPVRLGYRAPYLITAARQYIENPDRELTDFAGVGPKVANCVRLFGKHDLDSFPVDVWVKRVMHGLYGISEKDTERMHSFSKERFAPYGGIAQQYLFYYARNCE